MEDQAATDGQQFMPGRQPFTGKPQGRLKRGNTVNAGRKPGVIREAMREGSSKGLAHVIAIAQNKKCVEDTVTMWERGEDGKKHKQKPTAIKRRPTPQELIAANDFLAKYGIGNKVEMTIEDGPAETDVDWSALTDEELREYERILSKATRPSAS